MPVNKHRRSDEKQKSNRKVLIGLDASAQPWQQSLVGTCLPSGVALLRHPGVSGLGLLEKNSQSIWK